MSDANIPINERFVRNNYQPKPEEVVDPYDTTSRRSGPGSGVINAKKTLRGGGVGLALTGRGLQPAGQGVDTMGRKIMARGVAMSGTKGGSVVGAPLAVAGGAVSVGGKAITESGRALRQVGRDIASKNRAVAKLRLKTQALNPTAVVSDRLKIIRVMWLYGPFWLTIQLPLAVMLLVSLGMTGIVGSLSQDTGGNWFTNIVGFLAGSVLAVLKTLGADFEGVLYGLFMLFYILMIALGLAIVSALLLYFAMVRISGLSGTQSGLKLSLFLLTMISFAVPGLSLFPVIYLWLLVIMRHPK